MSPDTVTLAVALGVPRCEYQSDAEGERIVGYGAALDAAPVPLSPAQTAFCDAVLRGETEATLAAACRWECRRRILARYSETDQVNAQRRATVLLRREAVLARAIAANTATEVDIAEHAAVNAEGDALQAADGWINAMTAHWRTLAAAGRSPFADDAGWPEHP